MAFRSTYDRPDRIVWQVASSRETVWLLYFAESSDRHPGTVPTPENSFRLLREAPVQGCRRGVMPRRVGEIVLAQPTKWTRATPSQHTQTSEFKNSRTVYERTTSCSHLHPRYPICSVRVSHQSIRLNQGHGSQKYQKPSHSEVRSRRQAWDRLLTGRCWLNNFELKYGSVRGKAFGNMA